MEKLTKEERNAIQADIKRMYAEIVHMPQYAGRVHSFEEIWKRSVAIIRIVRLSGQKSITWVQFVRIAIAKDLQAYIRRKSGRNKHKSAPHKPPRPHFVSGGLPSLGKR